MARRRRHCLLVPPPTTCRKSCSFCQPRRCASESRRDVRRAPPRDAVKPAEPPCTSVSRAARAPDELRRRGAATISTTSGSRPPAGERIPTSAPGEGRRCVFCDPCSSTRKWTKTGLRVPHQDDPRAWKWGRAGTVGPVGLSLRALRPRGPAHAPAVCWRKLAWCRAPPILRLAGAGYLCLEEKFMAPQGRTREKFPIADVRSVGRVDQTRSRDFEIRHVVRVDATGKDRVKTDGGEEPHRPPGSDGIPKNPDRPGKEKPGSWEYLRTRQSVGRHSFLQEVGS